MAKSILAIASCRVSSHEQLENNSLIRQRDAVLEAAKALDAVIPEDGWWSGQVSSKRGTNVFRKDLQEMLARCKKDKRIKYLIVDEPDRFMRSIDEAAYFEVTFRNVGVIVWYASDPELNKGDLTSKLLKFTKYFSAEGSNEERSNKSIAGQTKALAEGRYPAPPPPGYRRGYQKAVHEIDDVRGAALKHVLVKVAEGILTPSSALKELNTTAFVKPGMKPYKMDRFRRILVDPYYAGIVEINRAVKQRNENGLHESLITKEQHEKILRVMSTNKKNQSGPRKNGNPDYPLSNEVVCEKCDGLENCRFVGYKNHNGKNKNRVYHRYRCRSCGLCLRKEDLHSQVTKQFNDYELNTDAMVQFRNALSVVWERNQTNIKQERASLNRQIELIKKSILSQVDAATDPANSYIKAEILESISLKKDNLQTLEDKLFESENKSKENYSKFIEFAFDFIQNMGDDFFVRNPSNMKKCKQLYFPRSFYLNENKKVYTPEVSPIIRLVSKQKEADVPQKSNMVRVRRL